MIERIVIDASAAIRAAIEGEPGHPEAIDCLERAVASGTEIIAPDLFPYEIGSVLARSGLSPKRRMETWLATCEAVELRRPGVDAFLRALSLAAEKKLSYYDAAYLALCEEFDAILWTEDLALLSRAPDRAVSTATLATRL